ncbi:glycoside hydrolase family 97 protein [Streptomyces sp. NPDC049879]|uniref:glycoside hydrolase family 97 protein n=1 Tax=Streptomyces sp. NPDC049879 TaxID=3365598 RepID=UPI0037BACC22
MTALVPVLALLLLTLWAAPSSAAPPAPGAAPADAAPPAAGPAATSPDGTLTLAVSAPGGRLTYSVSRAGTLLVAPSDLGLRLTDGTVLGDGVTVTGHRTRAHDSTWQPVWGADAEVRDRYEELTVDLRQRDGRTFSLVVRAYDDGVAFRYDVPEQPGLRSLSIADEATEFDLTGDPAAWWTPRDDNSDENPWRSTPLSAMGKSNAPVTFRWPDGTHLSVHEADLVDYAAMTVTPEDGSLRAELVPTPGRDAAVVTRAGRALPWRALTVTPGAAGLIESHLLENLNPPCRICGGDTSWIEPVKYVGIWWVMQQDQATWETGPRHGATTARAKRYIDFAAANGIEGLLAEGWNQGWAGDWGDQSFTRPTADFDLREVVSYARERGVEFIMHNETGANVENYEAQLDEAFTLYEDLGVNYVKTGYVGDIPGHNHYDQFMINHYRRVLEAAAEHRINVNCHECVHASGEMRTYPNAISREAVRGQEWDAFSEGNTPEHTLILPFTRGLSGPMDYTPGIMDILWDPQQLGRRVHTTVGKQLAYYVTYFSGLQMAADLPEHYRDAPGLGFIRDVPARWDRTEVLAAEVGDHLVTARRSGREWFTGAMTGEHARTLSYPLAFLGAGEWVAEAYTDAPDADYDTNPTALAVTRTLVTAADTFTADLGRSGGQAVRFRPATRADLATLPRHTP